MARKKRHSRKRGKPRRRHSKRRHSKRRHSNVGGEDMEFEMISMSPVSGRGEITRGLVGRNPSSTAKKHKQADAEIYQRIIRQLRRRRRRNKKDNLPLRRVLSADGVGQPEGEKYEIDIEEFMQLNRTKREKELEKIVLKKMEKKEKLNEEEEAFWVVLQKRMERDRRKKQYEKEHRQKERLMRWIREYGGDWVSLYGMSLAELKDVKWDLIKRIGEEHSMGGPNLATPPSSDEYGGIQTKKKRRSHKRRQGTKKRGKHGKRRSGKRRSGKRRSGKRR